MFKLNINTNLVWYLIFLLHLCILFYYVFVLYYTDLYIFDYFISYLLPVNYFGDCYLYGFFIFNSTRRYSSGLLKFDEIYWKVTNYIISDLSGFIYLYKSDILEYFYSDHNIISLYPYDKHSNILPMCGTLPNNDLRILVSSYYNTLSKFIDGPLPTGYYDVRKSLPSTTVSDKFLYFYLESVRTQICTSYDHFRDQLKCKYEFISKLCTFFIKKLGICYVDTNILRHILNILFDISICKLHSWCTEDNSNITLIALSKNNDYLLNYFNAIQHRLYYSDFSRILYSYICCDGIMLRKVEFLYGQLYTIIHNDFSTSTPLLRGICNLFASSCADKRTTYDIVHSSGIIYHIEDMYNYIHFTSESNFTSCSVGYNVYTRRYDVPKTTCNLYTFVSYILGRYSEILFHAMSCDHSSIVDICNLYDDRDIFVYKFYNDFDTLHPGVSSFFKGGLFTSDLSILDLSTVRALSDLLLKFSDFLRYGPCVAATSKFVDKYVSMVNDITDSRRVVNGIFETSRIYLVMFKLLFIDSGCRDHIRNGDKPSLAAYIKGPMLDVMFDYYEVHIERHLRWRDPNF